MSDGETYLHRARMRQDRLRRLLDIHFAGRSEFVLELGCGHGHFLSAYAAAHPRQHCVGIDLVTRRILRAERKRRTCGLDNLAFFKADIDEFFLALPQHVRIRRVFLLFPDPWPKRRHWKHRLTRPDRLDRIAAHCTSETDFYFRTDDLPFFEWTNANIRNHPAWQPAPERSWPFEADTVFQSYAPGYHSMAALHQPYSVSHLREPYSGCTQHHARHGSVVKREAR